jgi:hypothetical protein
VDASARGWLVLVAVGGTLVGLPAIAWTTWLRWSRPRPVPLFVIALAATAPLIAGLAGAARGALLLVSFEKSDEADLVQAIDPSHKARLFAETISDAMNATLVVTIGAAIVCGIGLLALRRRRGPPPA